MKQYRTNGAIGAILDEYERAIQELKQVIAPISDEKLITIVDSTTKDPACRSIQTILSHVVKAGYSYAIETRRHLGESIDFVTAVALDSTTDYQLALDKMFRFNEQLFMDYPNLKMEENDQAKKMIVRWGQTYDVEQLFEHAIVHILRHRRQIERFLIHLKTK